MKTFLRRLEILNFLSTHTEACGTESIVQHLTNSGYIEPTETKNKSLFRLIQRDLNFLLGEQFEPNEYDNDFGLTVEQGLGKSRHWQLDPYAPLRYDFEKMPAFMALALSLTQKHLKQVLPSTIQTELKRIFLGAESKLHQGELKISPLHYQRLTDSVEFFQRGQRLQAPQFDINNLDAIYRAILTGKRLTISYRSQAGLQDYDLHPFGVVIMLPKLYLVAKKHANIQQNVNAESPGNTDIPDKTERNDETFRSFLIHKIESVTLSTLPNYVPENFQMKTYLDDGNMDVLLERNDNKGYTLKLELKLNPQSNLISDLSESPISPNQTLTQISETHWHLHAEVKRTIQLRNWLLSLGSQAKILSPEIIRKELLGVINDIQKNYP